MATNPYSYGSLGARWTVGEPTSKSLLDISRVKNDANRWVLEQLLTDPDDSTTGFGLLNGVTATTQSPSDNSTKVATTAYADAAASASATPPGGANTQIQYNNSGVFGASSNLTFDGSTLAVTGAQTLSGNLTVNTSKLFVNATTGDVGIGTASPGSYGTASGTTLIVGSDAVLDNGGISIITNSGYKGRLAFGDGTGDPAQWMGIIEYSNPSDQMSFYTSNTQRMILDGSRLDVTGEVRASAGVLFGSDTAAANTLDDYEEGTWTPVWKFGTTTNTVTDEQAWYSKIGRTVTVWYRGYLNSAPSGTGALNIEGLPYTTTNTTNRITSMAIYWNLINFDSVAITVPANSSTATIVGLTNSTSTAETNVTNSNCVQYTQIRFAFSYESAS